MQEDELRVARGGGRQRRRFLALKLKREIFAVHPNRRAGARAVGPDDPIRHRARQRPEADGLALRGLVRSRGGSERQRGRRSQEHLVRLGSEQPRSGGQSERRGATREGAERARLQPDGGAAAADAGQTAGGMPDGRHLPASAQVLVSEEEKDLSSN